MMTSVNSQYDRNRQWKAIAFLALTCLVMVICLTQRASVLRDLQMTSANVAFSTQSDVDTHASASLSPCQLSAHSLLSTQPVFFEHVLLMSGQLLLVLSLFVTVAWCPPLDDTSPLTERRIYLKNCVFRE
ncbi:copper-binding protein [Acerihabitans sp. TG2]|uniref:copper-binding protein n=1 Tax=Acerihabitans sp. TG2 TaxID=3096008 RepID=UPI002B22DD5E|nr:copper-binding protein [Acerihabitans sp. TG2]MEA9392957.1 copper-binding protein [Acerihabitans sp. TG2]